MQKTATCWNAQVLRYRHRCPPQLLRLDSNPWLRTYHLYGYVTWVGQGEPPCFFFGHDEGDGGWWYSPYHRGLQQKSMARGRMGRDRHRCQSSSLHETLQTSRNSTLLMMNFCNISILSTGSWNSSSNKAKFKLGTHRSFNCFFSSHPLYTSISFFLWKKNKFSKQSISGSGRFHQVGTSSWMFSTHTFGSHILFTYGTFHLGHRDAGLPCCHREPLGETNGRRLKAIGTPFKWWVWGFNLKFWVIVMNLYSWKAF